MLWYFIIIIFWRYLKLLDELNKFLFKWILNFKYGIIRYNIYIFIGNKCDMDENLRKVDKK